MWTVISATVTQRISLTIRLCSLAPPLPKYIYFLAAGILQVWKLPEGMP